MDVTHLGGRVYHNGHSRTPFGHVAAISNENDARLNGMNLTGAHVAEDTLHGGGTDNNTAHQVAFVRQILLQYAVDDVVGKDA